MKQKKKVLIIAGIAVAVLIIAGFLLRDVIFPDTSAGGDEQEASVSIPEASDDIDGSAAEAIDSEDALDLLNNALESDGIDVAELDLTLYYDEPELVLTQDYSEFIDAWIFIGNDTYFYAVTLDDGQLYRYDMVNGALMGIDETFED